MQVKVLNQTILGSPDWGQFLRRSSSMIAAVLLGSALIMAIAANWLSWPKVGRIALLQVTITALVVLAWWSGQRKPKDWARAYSLSSISLNLAAIAVGGLLALIGQSYQTGADPWQLFALWALLLVPWLLAVRSLFIILLVLTITNIALYLYFSVLPLSGALSLIYFAIEGVGLSLIAVNLLALLLSHLLAARFVDTMLIVRRVSMLYLIAAVLWWQSQAWFNGTDWVWVKNTIALAGMGALAWFYLRQLHDVLTGALAYIAVYILAIGLVIYGLHWFDFSFIGLFYVCLLIGGFLIYDLRRMWRLRPIDTDPSSEPIEHDKEPWFLRVFYFGAQAVATVFFLLSWVMTFGEPTPVTTHIFVVLAIAAIVYLQRCQSHVLTQDLSLFLLMSMCLMGVVGLGIFVLDHLGVMLWFMALSVLVYVVSAKAWLVRYTSALMATLFLFFALFARQPWFWEQNNLVVSWLVTVLLWASVGLAFFLHFKPKHKQTLTPLWWAWMSLVLCWAASRTLMQQEVYTVVSISAAILPAGLLYLLLRSSQHGLWFSAGCAAVLGALGAGWLYTIPLANLALVFWLWAYAERQQALFVLAVALLLAALGVYYYELQWLLIHKAMALAAGGVWLGVGALLLRQRQAEGVKKAESMTNKSTFAFVGSLWFGLGVVLALSAQDVARKEHLLKTGQSVVLRLAPVDPRSLMQGDYMTLNFALGQQVHRLMPQLTALEPHRAPKLLAYLVPSPDGQATLKALENTASGQVLVEQAPDQWVEVDSVERYLPVGFAVLELVQKHSNWLPNGVDAWFFPEGQAEYFEQARYGEFKTNAKGKALLFQLLDVKAQPLAAPAELLDK